MMDLTLNKSAITPAQQERIARLSKDQRELLPLAFGGFLDTAATATARASYYNTRAEQDAAIQAVHNDLIAVDRGVYAASLALPGVTDHSRQTGIAGLLRSQVSQDSVLDAASESAIVYGLTNMLPPQRMLKMFAALRRDRVNNARVRKLILNCVLGAKNLELWAVKYRRKLASALTHAWGRRTASILQTILAKPAIDRDQKDRKIVARCIGRFVDQRNVDSWMDTVEQCVHFILGDESNLTLARLVAYRDAKVRLENGRKLPLETLEGLRSRFHRDRSSAEVLDLAKSQLTSGQKIALQRKAIEADVKIEFDPSQYDAVRLYIYAYEMGLSEEIREELIRKAEKTADRLPVRFDRVGILLDASASMQGHQTQAYRPMAIALALRDTMAKTATEAVIVTSDGRDAPVASLVEPVGHTSMASALIKLIKADVEVVIVLTDGYENAPAGQFADVVNALDRIGVDVPIHQFSPVFAAEARGIRTLSDSVPGLPVSKPESIGLGVLKALIESDLQRGIAALLNMVQPVIAGRLNDGRSAAVAHINRDAERIEEVTHGIS